MNPHLGQLFQLRVVRQDNLVEVGRVTVPSILVPDFTVLIPGFELNHGYNTDFYADFNGNGVYDPPPADHAWRLTFNSSNGDITQDFLHNTNFTDIEWPDPSSVEEVQGIVNGYSLYQNYPNPFNPSTLIKFSLETAGFVTLKVFNALGAEVAELINDELDAGLYQFEFLANNLSSGIYFYTLRSGNFISSKKMILIR
jgi:hypothetical protein